MSSDDAPGAQETVASVGDEALMRRIREADAKALECFYDRYSSRVFAFCLRSLADRAECEDLVLEIFWELWSRPERYDPARSSPWTYLMQMTRSRLVDRLRSLRARSSHQFLASDSQAPAQTSQAVQSHEPFEQVARSEDDNRLHAAMESLTPEQRRALEMAYFDAMSYSQVAEALGQPLGTVKSRIRQALAQLRRMLT